MQLVSKKYRNDCKFKSFDNDQTATCRFPKAIRICRTCSCYFKTDSQALYKDDVQFISFVLAKKTANRALLLSSISLIISMLMLLLQLCKIILDV